MFSDDNCQKQQEDESLDANSEKQLTLVPGFLVTDSVFSNQVIAIVTDRLTDNLIISDLCIAASRGVPVYIILNQRSAQDKDPPHKLRHPVRNL